ncbi:unnamed protein product [Musa acuminata subsp. burmannicoides]
MPESVEKMDAGAGSKDGKSEEDREESRRADAGRSRDANATSQVRIAEFDYSVENFFAAMDAIGDLCRTSGGESVDTSEIQRFSSTITFLKEWKFFCYEPKVINFTCEEVKDAAEDISLPQFSSAAVPKISQLPDERKQSESNDFILHAGGLVWALDWCPGSHEKRDSKIKCEYLAVSAHPPSSAYHKIGVPVIGRGMIQIWCLLNLDEEIEIPTASSRGRGRPRKENIIQKHDLDGINVSATRRPRGRPRKKPEIEKSTTPRPRGRPRKRPASSSDEEFSPTRPQGRSEKLMQSAVDLNGLNDVSLQNLTRSPVKSTRTCSNDDRISSLRKSRGRPRKHSIPGIINVNEKEAAPPLGNNEIKSTVNTVVPSCVDSGKNSVDLPVLSGECKEDLIQPRRRGRPRKKPILSLNNSVSSANESGNDATTLPNPSEHRTNGDTLHLFAENEILKTRDNVPSLSESQNNSLSLPVLPALNCKEEPIQPKRRGRPRKKQVQSLNNFISSSLDVLGNDTNVLPNSGRLGISDGKEKLLCSNNENLKTGDNVLSLSVESQNNLADVKCKEELIQPRSRGRPRKEVLNLPVSVRVSNALPRKDTNDKDDNISKGQTGLESVPSDVTVRREEKGNNKEDHNCESTILSELSRDCKLSAECVPTHDHHYEDSVLFNHETVDKRSPEVESVHPLIPHILALPRVVFCLAHNGKVAWDVKWKPPTTNAACKHRMGYLAVLLGNGSLEVWEVPLPGLVKALYTSSRDEVSDPRFLKLTPVFRCSKLKYGDRLSIPLTVEWSPSMPHDLILAGCHDGTVALWKFSTQCSSQDTRPLLCFTADSAPLRALAWAPDASEVESSNVFVTAGHDGLKFWDLRDPYRPLWEINSIQRTVLSVDWLKDPRCIVITLDDGTVRFLSLYHAAYDVPVTGTPFVRSKYQGLHSFSCTSFAIWSIHVSQTTGFAAYGCADGSTVRFQLTTRFVDKDPRRGRTPHFLCGSLSSEGGTFKIYTPLPNTPLAHVPFIQKKPSNECRNANRTIQSNFLDTEQTKGEDSPFPASSSGGDRAMLSGAGGSQVPSKTTAKSRNGTKRHDPSQMTDQSFGISKEGQKISEKCKTQDDKEEYEVFPPKVLAIHRVRWNMNKGSERWLCYGGAAGIIRCQQMF